MTDSTSLDTNPPGLGDVSNAVSGAGKSATPWLKMISDAEKAFREYQVKSDNIDKQYANLERLAKSDRDREIQLFWANISVMAPSVYSRPPVPVVVPRYKQREELPRVASEIVERSTGVTFEREEIDGEMRLIRDDLVILSRGAAWLRYDTKDGQRVCIDQADRKDFLHGPARKWKEVDWVAKRSWLDKDAAKARFSRTSGDAYKSLQYAVRKDAKTSGDDDDTEKAGIWELWCKSQNRVVWVSEGCEVCLDNDEPHLTLEGFFPCPKPAYGTLQRRTLIPVPDMAFYKDQLEEINEITARIAALTEALRVRGFYAAGQGDISDAIEKAFKATTNNQVMMPVNLTGLSGQSLKDAIAWLPIDVISATITAIIAIRKELINDVYEVTGLSDIMRGQTEASETLGAQQLKSEYGSVRIKDKQNELIRLARDITRITSEIIAENFSGETLMEMAQMPLPTDAVIEQQAVQLQAQLTKVHADLPAAQQQLQALQQEIQHAQSDPEVQQMAQANPDQAKQIVGAAQQHMQELQGQVQQMTQLEQSLPQQLQKLAATVTIDKVLKLLREQKLRPFILDIETDSTIAPDENASKQRATEFVTAVGGYLKNSLPLVQEMPAAAGVVGETLKFITDQFRAGRQLQGVIEKFADDMETKAQQPPPPNPEVVKAQQEAQAAQAKQAQDMETAKADNAAKSAQAQKDMAEANATTTQAHTAAADADLKRRVDEATAASDLDGKAAERHAKLIEAQAAADAKVAEAQAKLIAEHTAAADADLKRRVAEQEAIDAAAARQQERTDKAALAAQQMAHAAEKHQQDLEKGALAIEHQKVTTASALARDAAAADVAEAAAAEKKSAAAQKTKEPA